MASNSAPDLNAVVTAREDLNEALIVIRAEFEDGDQPSFVPGQFTNLGLPASGEEGGANGFVKRPYSVASAPSEKGVEFFIRLVEDGALTPKLWKLGAGDRLWMDKRFLGKFTLEHLPESPAQADRDLVMVSTGTGLAPFVSMLREFRAARPWRRFVMINGVRIESDLGYRQELESLDRETDWFTYLPICSRVDADGPWRGLRGRVGEALDPALYSDLVGVPLDTDHSQVFLRGNPDMIDTVQADLEGRGFQRHKRKDPGQLHLERYW